MRRDDREVQDGAEIQCILKVTKVLRLGFTDGDYPYIAPLHYGYVHAGDVLRFYIHGAKEGKKLALAMSNPHVFVELDCEVETTGEGDTACVYGINYASLMVRDEAMVVEDPEEKIEGLKLLMRVQTGRDFEITAWQATGVTVFRFNTESCNVEKRKKKQRQLRQWQTARRQHIRKAV